ncbi:MAG: hypothetical protein O2923_04000 [Verrucomicrobia bacterium]|nr:hypothetical protein [Verrucomicrobiota bacterium]MDA1086360.1 hypothetical protein [Verrucomicrobiota bacterium]
MTNILGYQLYTLQKFEGGMEAAFEAVKGLGIDHIEAWCGAVPDDPNASTSLDDMRQALSNTGMQLTCGHLTVDEFDNRYEAWRDLLKDFGPERGIVLADWIKKYEGRVCSLHVNDANAEVASTRLGEGSCGAEEAIRAAVDTGVDTFIIETMLTRDNVDDIKRDVEFTRKLIG